MKQNKKVVYIHRKKTDDTIFYIGIGNEDRPYSKERSVVWHRTVKKYGYYIEVILKDLSKEEACEIEIYLIEKFGRRDKNKGYLVNLTDGGDGVVGGKGRHLAVYNIETGEMFETIKEGARSVGKSKSAITAQIGNYYKPKVIDTKLRLISEPYPENTKFWNEVRKYEVSIESDEFKETYDDSYLGYENTEFDDDESEILKRIYEQTEESIDLIDAIYTKSIRQIAEEDGLNRMSVFRMFDKCKANILKNRIGEYKNKSLKHMNKHN